MVYIHLKNDNNYKIIKFSEDNNDINEIDIKAYACQLVCINKFICLVCDLPKNYTLEQKKLKNQELIGNSSLIILE